MNADLLLLTLLYAVAFTGFIGAINSRGPIRVVLSYFLAILTLCAAVFHTSQYLVAGGSAPTGGFSSTGPLQSRSDEAVVVIPPPFPTVVTEPAPTPITPTVDTTALIDSKNQVAVGASKNELKGILEVARRISRNLAAMNLGNAAEVSDEEYETLQNRTIGLLSEARRTKEKLAPLVAGAPEPVKPAAENLAKGVEALVTSAFNAERFFKSENDSEEKTHLAAYRRGNQTATTLLKNVGADLGADGTALSADASE